ALLAGEQGINGPAYVAAHKTQELAQVAFLLDILAQCPFTLSPSSTPPGSTGTTPPFRVWPSRCTTRATLRACQSWQMPWKKLAAPMPTSSIIAGDRGRMCGAAGWWIWCWANNNACSNVGWTFLL